jgi:transcriptional regulator with XRE-family HTH domain
LRYYKDSEMNNESIEFGKYLSKLRKETKLTIKELEQQIGVSNPYISQIEIGVRGIPSPDTLQKLSLSLNVSFMELMEKAGYIEQRRKETI